MDAIALLPGVIALFWALYRSPSRAALDIHLPTLMLLPGFCRWEFQGLPDFTFGQAAILPVALCYLVRSWSSWRLTRMDLWVVLFVFGAAYSESLHQSTPDAIATLFDMLTSALLPYVLGKALIEQMDLRYTLTRRFVFLLAIAGCICIYEFRMGVNPMVQLWLRIFPAHQNIWVTQIRWGFGRVAGPFSHAILAGLVFSMGIVLNYWLMKVGAWRRVYSFSGIRIRQGQIFQCVLWLGLLMTMSRGPWMGCVCGLFTASIAGARNVKRRAFRILIGIAVIVLGAFAVTMAMTAGGWRSDDRSTTETAAYRRELVSNYMPLVEEGGVWGWGRVAPPKVPGQPSIDNNYLLVALTQGYFGFVVFTLIVAETLILLWRRGTNPATVEDRWTAFALLGAVVATLISIATVYLGSQSFQLMFIIIGWAQALRFRLPQAPASSRAVAPTQQLAFSRLLA